MMTRMKMYAEEKMKAEIISEAMQKKVVKPSHRRERDCKPEYDMKSRM